MIEVSGRAGDLHRWSPRFDRAELRLVRVERRAIVLGSTQPDGDVDAERAAELGFEVARRRSGGGAVELGDASVWVDVTLPSTDPRFVHDVGLAAQWVGRLWVEAMVMAGADRSSLSVHMGPAVAVDEGKVMCFAGVGAGEVLARGRKVVGISQRRTRSGAWFQCVGYRDWSPERVLTMLRVAPDRSSSIEAIAARCHDHVGALGVEPALLVANLQRCLDATTFSLGQRAT